MMLSESNYWTDYLHKSKSGRMMMFTNAQSGILLWPKIEQPNAVGLDQKDRHEGGLLKNTD
jgi:hypothetical protein